MSIFLIWLHDALMMLAILLYVLGVVSGWLVMSSVSKSIEPRLSVAHGYLCGLLIAALRFNPPPAWSRAGALSALWFSVWASVAGCLMFAVLAMQYQAGGGAAQLGLAHALPWPFAHVLTGFSIFIFHMIIAHFARTKGRTNVNTITGE